MYQATIIISNSNTCKVKFTPTRGTEPTACEKTANGFSITCHGPNPWLGTLTRVYPDARKVEAYITDERR